MGSEPVPDGTRLAYNRSENEFDWGANIWVMDADGANQTNHTNSVDTQQYAPDWSPDSTQLTFFRYVEGVAISTQSDIFVMNADGSNPRLVTTNTAATNEYFPVWSPDGTMITYTGNTLNTSNFDVYVINVDGTGVRQVTFGPRFNGRCDWGRLSPTNKDECKKNGHKRFSSPTFERFRNQGQCAAFVQASEDADKQ